jgi:hypothetical protein
MNVTAWFKNLALGRLTASPTLPPHMFEWKMIELAVGDFDKLDPDVRGVSVYFRAGDPNNCWPKSRQPDGKE